MGIEGYRREVSAYPRAYLQMEQMNAPALVRATNDIRVEARKDLALHCYDRKPSTLSNSRYHRRPGRVILSRTYRSQPRDSFRWRERPHLGKACVPTSPKKKPVWSGSRGQRMRDGSWQIFAFGTWVRACYPHQTCPQLNYGSPPGITRGGVHVLSLAS